MSTLTAKFVENTHIEARIYFTFIKNVLKQTRISFNTNLNKNMGEAVIK